MITKVSTANREEWKALRSKYIGGSDAASVVGMNPYKSAYGLWAEKTGKIPAFEGNLATEVGTFLEEFVAKKFEEHTGKKVRRVNQSFLNDLYPFAIANIDRDVVGEDAGLEIKTTSEMNLKRFKNGEFPANYYCQCMHYMAVTGKKKWYLAVLIGNRDFRVFEIERDADEINALMEAEKNFFVLVKNNIPPAPDGSEDCTKTISKLFPDSDDESVDLFGYSDVLEQYDAIGKQIKELETMQNEMSNRVKAFMGTAGKGSAGSFNVSWKTSTRKIFDTVGFIAANPGIDLDSFYKETTYRVFKVTKKKEKK